MEIENEYRLRQALTGDINLFLGAGFSVLASGNSGPLPIGDDLAEELRTRFSVDGERLLRLDQMSAVLSRSNREDLDEFLRNRYDVRVFDERYKILLDLSIGSIFTTNIDNLVPRIYAGSTRHYLNDVYQHGAALSDRESVELVQLHGRVDDRTRPLTFSTLDIAAARTSDPDQWNLFRQRLRTRPTIFWGYAMADSGTLEAVRATGSGAPTEGDAWIQVRPGPNAPAAAGYFRALGFQVIEADTSDLLDFLISVAPEIAGQESEPSHLSNVPGPGETVARPIEEYFLGYPPTWSDIYSRGVAQTSYLRQLQEKIAAKRNIILAGIPGCGKTTLLMQLAAFTETSGARLMFDGLSTARAELLARQLGNAPALIIIDNVASDFGAYEVMSALPNAIVVGADRDYNLGSVSARLRGTDAEVVSVSDLRAFDLQYLWDAIPLRIRRRERVNPEIEGGRGSSAFEFVLANVNATPLGDKLIEAIHTMHDEGALHADVLLAACYMHYARTSLSIDILIAHLRGLVGDYREIYTIVDQLGGLLNENELEDGDEFVARSMLVSEYVLRHVRPSILRTFLTRFHHEVSPLRVARYDTVRRRAYSWRVFARAFTTPSEGIEVYDGIVARDDSPEVLQQKALYLADKKLYEEAFFELDAARSSTSRLSWSIENSYFNVLFRANIDRALVDAASLAQCENALRGLDNCFEKDRRKGMHALIYGDCAIRYATTVDDPTAARTFLERAEYMLAAIIENESWLYRPPELLRQVQRAIRGLPTSSPSASWVDEL